jgi:colanic acid biosynthesis glycosyl transferase WcaI
VADVLVLTLVFPPDSVSTAQIMGELGDDLRRAGHHLSVITTTPHYNRDPEQEARQPLRPFWGRLVQESSFRGIRTFHTRMPAKGRSVAGRLLAWLQFHLLSLAVGIVVLRRVDVILTPSPPLTMGVVAWLLGIWHRAPFLYNVQELYPDIAINLGAVRNRWVIRLLFALERFVYSRATTIAVIADQMRRRLLEKGVPASKVIVIPNFVDVEALVPVPAPNGFTHEHGLDGRFVVTYAGNLGPAQGLDALLDASRLLADVPEVLVVLVGGGTLWTAFAQRIVQQHLNNVRLIAVQPFSRVPEIYGASDLNVVMLASSTGSDAVPSKVYRIMSCGKAVLAATEATSDLAALVREAGCGLTVPQDDPAAIAQAIRQACADRPALERMGQAGRRHVAANYARPIVTARYDRALTAMRGTKSA